MCVDYRDLNKASPKDDFPLPHIDTLVDNTAKFAVFSFLNGFSFIIKLRWLQKTWKRLYSSPFGEYFATRKLLSFIVSQRGIEVDPDKVRAIQEMHVPRTEKEVRGFLGRLNYISRFISHMTTTCELIFKLLQKNQAIEWNSDCQRAFEKIGQYLQEHPIPIPAIQGKPLFMYLIVLKKSMGCMLGQHDETDQKEHAIYYLSKKFTDCET
ncbi:hypothetical protein KIW84_033254 [Lathyrus oleraceus]|uniref:Reverse transcriptase/retrotransposon-derived protein RNase H-like domain-containing protein n=1 Tax=Pisum sativum TaxID=3888 RepID=A0A9D4XVA9_PEA|nr:hypothetical protein KIW84_033254 [Pisum sativum]